MISNIATRTLPQEAPPLVRELQQLLDARMIELYEVARREAPQQHNGSSPMYHIDMPYGPLQLTAVYDREHDRFTQLIARLASEAHHERPSFTISLFL